MDEISRKLNEFISFQGFEAYPFQIGWYNDSVIKNFHFKYPYNTLAYLFVSTPTMFEKVFCPFIKDWNCEGKNDPLDECMKDFFRKVANLFPEKDVEIVHDFEIHHSKRPKVLVQNAGHVSGAVYYYQRNHITHDDPWPQNKKIYGVCMHPKYGGWFGMRAVMIFKNTTVPHLTQKILDQTLTNEQIIFMLDKYNHSWNDGAFRDVITPIDRYSSLQQLYFQTSSDKRVELTNKIRDGTLV